MKSYKCKFVLDVLDDGAWRIDVREMGNKSIGHIVFSSTGVSWCAPNKRIDKRKETLWTDFIKGLTALTKMS